MVPGTQDVDRRSVARAGLAAALRGAIEREEFVLHYQPIVALDTDALVGFEALVRWRRTAGRLVPPGDFIPLAEELGLCVPLGWWTLREACRQLRAWHERSGAEALSVSVNVSARMFGEHDVVERVAAVLHETRLDPARLCLEITERTAMDHSDALLARLVRLRALGVQLHLDDFGTGYSSPHYLRRFRYDALKIDRSFVARLAEDSDAAIVGADLALARHMRIDVIAEGVETPDQRRRLREMGCPHAQGFFISPPVEPAAAETFLLMSLLHSSLVPPPRRAARAASPAEPGESPATRQCATAWARGASGPGKVAPADTRSRPARLAV